MEKMESAAGTTGSVTMTAEEFGSFAIRAMRDTVASKKYFLSLCEQGIIEENLEKINDKQLMILLSHATTCLKIWHYREPEYQSCLDFWAVLMLEVKRREEEGV